MIFQAPILALLLASTLASLVALWASGFGLRVLRQWDVTSGAATQLRLERKTELVSTLFRFVMLFEIFALVLFVFNADRMAALFVGAMCAVGTLGANEYGFPALYLKIGVFFAAALWITLDHVDRKGVDFPLTRQKFALLLIIAPLILVSAGIQLTYFLNLETDVITSCCSKLFTPANEGIAAEMTGMAPGRALWLLALAGVGVALSGAASMRFARGHQMFALAGIGFFLAAITAIISVISLYVYDHPNHHCPFCILKPEYGYIGYALYLPLFFATALAIGAGVVRTIATSDSLLAHRPQVTRRLTALSLAGFALFGLIVVWIILSSQLILFG